MTYKVVITREDGTSERKEMENGRKARWYAEGAALPIKMFAFSPVGRDVELLDGKGVRLLDASIPPGSEWALAWRDAKRTWVRGYATKEEAEEARKGLPKGCESAVLGSGQGLPWGVGPAFRPSGS